MYPLSYKVLNLPPSLRNKVHIGMHLAYLDSESKQCCKILAMELIDLYVNPIVINDTSIHVVVLSETFDGKGYEDWYNVQGCGSIAGCPKCINFHGTYVSPGRITFEGMRCNLPMNHKLRKKSKGEQDQAKPFFVTRCLSDPLHDRTYEDYVRDGK